MIDARSTVDWEKLERFIGFGRVDAPVVFVGMEEGLKSPDDLDSDLAIRSAYERPIMDIEEAHRGVAGTVSYFDPELAKIQPTWRVMADLMLRRDGNPHPTTAERRRYQALRLGRSDGDTLLIELLPYPSPSVRDWLYARFGRYPDREAYMEALLPLRVQLLSDVLFSAPRELVVCYGKGNWPHYERLFQDATWRNEGMYKVAEANGSRVVLTPHFVRREFNSNEDLARFASVALRFFK